MTALKFIAAVCIALLCLGFIPQEAVWLAPLGVALVLIGLDVAGFKRAAAVLACVSIVGCWVIGAWLLVL